MNKTGMQTGREEDSLLQTQMNAHNKVHDKRGSMAMGLMSPQGRSTPQMQEESRGLPKIYSNKVRLLIIQ
jgi:hypothetical protein